MDPLSFSVAIAGIPGIFTSCVDCFQYIQLARAFSKDFGYCLGKLEAAEMQFTRWGESMGLTKEPFDPDSLFKSGSWNEQDIKKAERLLGWINDAFEDAKKASEKYKATIEDDDNEAELLEVPDQSAELEKADPKKKRLVFSMRKITKKRQKQISLGSKIKWALYRRTDFDNLVGTIGDLVDKLVTLFPALHPQQKELCQEEAKSIEKEDVPALIEVMGKHDKMLNLAITERIQTENLVYDQFVIDGSGFTRLGNTYENVPNARPQGINMTRFHVGGSGTFQGGHRFTSMTLPGGEGAERAAGKDNAKK